MRASKEHRKERLEYIKKRRERCISYIRRTKSLPEAKALAKKDHWGANTSAWISAYGRLLQQRLLTTNKEVL